MTKRYFVDWGDQWFPKIVEAGPGDEVGQSFGACKKEITDKCKHMISHWRAINKQTRPLKPSDAVPYRDRSRIL
jgi:hypothetical protein